MIKKLFSKSTAAKLSAFLLAFGLIALFTSSAFAQSAQVEVNQGRLGFKIPDFSDILTFAIRGFFVIAGLAALFYLLLGAFGWVTSGGDKDAITAARDKITNSVIGLILIIAVLAVVVTLETIVFQRRLCLGLSCPASIPGLLQVKCFQTVGGVDLTVPSGQPNRNTTNGGAPDGTKPGDCCPERYLRDTAGNDGWPDVCTWN